ncbi:ATP-citrate synthase beta chain protein 1 [Hordeum vulgare]|nr:ATP-citrate synthase beta chain protein 1 [Hordeum vulgare]
MEPAPRHLVARSGAPFPGAVAGQENDGVVVSELKVSPSAPFFAWHKHAKKSIRMVDTISVTVKDDGLKLIQVIIGPATVEGVQAGALKIGDTAGTIDNIIQCKLYRPGSVGFVSKSYIFPTIYFGCMSNELYNTITRVIDSIYEGIAIGGDIFPGSTLSDQILRFNNIPQETLHKHKASENGNQSVEALEDHLIDPQEKVEQFGSADTKKSLFRNWPLMSSIIDVPLLGVEP